MNRIECFSNGSGRFVEGSAIQLQWQVRERGALLAASEISCCTGSWAQMEFHALINDKADLLRGHNETVARAKYRSESI